MQKMLRIFAQCRQAMASSGDQPARLSGPAALSRLIQDTEVAAATPAAAAPSAGAQVATLLSSGRNTNIATLPFAPGDGP